MIYKNDTVKTVKSDKVDALCVRQKERRTDVWVMFSFCLSEFKNVCWGWTGGQAISKIDVHAAVCMCTHMCICGLLLWHHCCRHCSHLTVTPLWLRAWQPPTLSPSTPLLPLLTPCSIYNPPTNSVSLGFFFFFSSIFSSIHYPLFSLHPPPFL